MAEELRKLRADGRERKRASDILNSASTYCGVGVHRHQPCKRQIRDGELKVEIARIHQVNCSAYGALMHRGALMRDFGLVGHAGQEEAHHDR